MGSPLGTLVANIFITSIDKESNTNTLCRYTHAYVEPTKVEFILTKPNNHHPNINFKFELKKNNEINFLEVLVKRFNHNKLETGVYRKPISINIYINWNAGFIKSTNHQQTDHPTTDAVIMFTRLENSKIFTLQNTKTAGKM